MPDKPTQNLKSITYDPYFGPGFVKDFLATDAPEIRRAVENAREAFEVTPDRVSPPLEELLLRPLEREARDYLHKHTPSFVIPDRLTMSDIYRLVRGEYGPITGRQEDAVHILWSIWKIRSFSAESEIGLYSGKKFVRVDARLTKRLQQSFDEQNCEIALMMAAAFRLGFRLEYELKLKGWARLATRTRDLSREKRERVQINQVRSKKGVDANPLRTRRNLWKSRSIKVIPANWTGNKGIQVVVEKVKQALHEKYPGEPWYPKNGAIRSYIQHLF